MKKIAFILWITLIIVSCTDHSTMVEVEGDSSSSALKLSSSTTAFSSSVIGLSSSDNFSSESLQSSSSVKFSSSAILSSSSSVISSSSSQYSSSSITQSSSSLVTQLSSSIIVVSSSSLCTNTYGTNTVTDCRDGQTYKMVMIGTQTWMAENLNYTVDSSWCYNNSADSCAKYGHLYQWASAMDIDSAYNSTTWGGSDVNHQGICPDDWHLPSNDEWQALYDYVAAKTDKCKDGVSKGCLQGTWIMPGLYLNATDTAPSLRFSPPDTLYLDMTNEDTPAAEENFTMVYTSSSLSEDVCGTMYGKWWISGTNTVHFKSTVSDCIKEFDAVVTVNEFQIFFAQSYFHNTLIGIEPGIEIFDNGTENVGTSLKNSSGWKYDADVATGTNDFGFSALPAGNRHNDGSFYYAGYGAYFWSATESSSDYANYWNLNYNGGDFDNVSNNFKNDGFSVRCLKN